MTIPIFDNIATITIEVINKIILSKLINSLNQQHMIAPIEIIKFLVERLINPFFKFIPNPFVITFRKVFIMDPINAIKEMIDAIKYPWNMRQRKIPNNINSSL